MPAPKNKKELQSFLGVINYLGQILTRYGRSVQPIAKADIKQDALDVECIIPTAV